MNTLYLQEQLTNSEIPFFKVETYKGEETLLTFDKVAILTHSILIWIKL